MVIELSNIRKFRVGRREVVCYPKADIDLIKYKLEVAHGFRRVIYVEGNSIRDRDGIFEKSEILLKK